MAVSYLLKEHTSIQKIFFGSLVGVSALFFLFLPISFLTLLAVKIGVSILMILVTFSYANRTLFIKQISTLYLASIILGGIIYLLSDTFCYERQGILFLQNKTSIHFLIILLFGPILFYCYMKKLKEEKQNLTLVHHLELEVLGKKYQLEGFLDTGNQLKDPYKKRSVILLYDKNFLPKIEEGILVPFQTAKGTGLVRCVVPRKVIVDGKEFQNYLVGFLEEEVQIEGRNCILPNQMREELE